MSGYVRKYVRHVCFGGNHSKTSILFVFASLFLCVCAVVLVFVFAVECFCLLFFDVFVSLCLVWFACLCVGLFGLFVFVLGIYLGCIWSVCFLVVLCSYG